MLQLVDNRTIKKILDVHAVKTPDSFHLMQPHLIERIVSVVGLSLDLIAGGEISGTLLLQSYYSAKIIVELCQYCCRTTTQQSEC